MGKGEKRLRADQKAQKAQKAQEAQEEVPLSGGFLSSGIHHLATKLYRPQLPPHFLLRQRLLDDLEEGRGLPLVLVLLPAGYVKSPRLASCHH